jgi:hypothetical protein
VAAVRRRGVTEFVDGQCKVLYYFDQFEPACDL